MKLLKLELTGLFDVFNHEINCNQNERITILTAPNGYGKTITLKVIYSLFNKEFNFFHELPFEKITFLFDNKVTIEINKAGYGFELSLKENGKSIHNWMYVSKLDKMSTRLLRDINRVRRYSRVYGRENKMLSTNARKKLLRSEDIFSSEPSPPKTNMRKEIKSIIDSLEVYLIEEQRLVIRQSEDESESRYEHGERNTDTIQQHSEELSRLIKETTNEYAQQAQSLDSSFPKRLFKNDIDDKNLDVRLSKLQKKQKKISDFGLLRLEEDVFLQKSEIKNEDKKVLSLYIKDSEKKLSVFDSLVNRIELFCKILNDRRFDSKRIKIDTNKGFIFETCNGTELESTELSSGEQHEVVLLFELLFHAKKNSLVLIDEPEISLHVVWQKEFLSDIKEIIKLQKIDVIIATHSPQIINEHWDLTINLDKELEQFTK